MIVWVGSWANQASTLRLAHGIFFGAFVAWCIRILAIKFIVSARALRLGIVSDLAVI